MLERIEFYISPDGSVNIKKQDEAPFVYEPNHTEITDEMLLLIRDVYPEAYEALAKTYEKSQRNVRYFNYLMVHRFIRCNFGEHDTLSADVSETGLFNFEEVKCPLRGECKNEGIICKPKTLTALTEREKKVAELIAKGMNSVEIADELLISQYTVRRHIQKIKARLHLRNTQQIATVYYQSVSK